MYKLQEFTSDFASFIIYYYVIYVYLRFYFFFIYNKKWIVLDVYYVFCSRKNAQSKM